MNVTLSESTRTFLAEPRFAVLATINPDGTPHQMRRDNRVSLCI
ncbi:MAG: pyridoxamine 5'-phosphate oxidase family protein [Chloroflexi bacterium]|nr:pyridoxamine 5'-phosphate oxidase family protein [Chloroflexota bacterium]